MRGFKVSVVLTLATSFALTMASGARAALYWSTIYSDEAPWTNAGGTGWSTSVADGTISRGVMAAIMTPTSRALPVA